MTAPDRIWIEADENPYYYEESDRNEATSPITEYIRADVVDEMARALELAINNHGQMVMDEIQAEQEQLEANQDATPNTDKEVTPEPHLVLYNSIDAYGQAHLGMAAGMAASSEEVEDNLSAPNVEILHIFDMVEADNFFKQVKQIKKHFKKLKGFYNAE